VGVLLVLLLSAAFGAADQYLGSLSAHPWAADVSLLSAPWLLLPFAVGCTQRSAPRSVVLGPVATWCALAGYCVMTLSPVENAHLTLGGVEAFIRSGNDRWFVSALVTGPVFALLGNRWRVARSWWAPSTVGLLVALEPVVHLLRGSSIRSSLVAATEVGLGLVILGAAAHPVSRSGIHTDAS
jgi:hypothetical protein